MNRTALCIKMLNLLKARGRIQASEMAELLDTNVRNIREFKKELEVAGYHIISHTGKLGGYELCEDDLLPTLSFNQKEVEALKQSTILVKNKNKGFLDVDDYLCAMDKVFAVTRNLSEVELSIIGTQGNETDRNVQQWVELSKQAKNNNNIMYLTYQSISSKKVETFVIEPYDLIYYRDSYYLIAYARERGGYRTYKFSPMRMIDLKKGDKKFARDERFRLKDVLGQQSLMKDEMYHLQFKVKGMSAILLNEKTIGIELEKRMENEILYVETLMEGKQSIIGFLLSLGHFVEVIGPKNIRKEYEYEVLKMCQGIQE